jgi:hypothetical protein
MKLTAEEQAMLDGEHGRATQKAMQILAALGKIYSAECMLPVTSAQIAGVSYDNLNEAGLQFLSEMADGGGRARVLTTLNPAGMDIENWTALGIDQEFASNQQRVIEAFARMGVITTCTCTPYLAGNLPHYGEHIAWAESSAVCFANSVIGARSNREGGPSALAAALTGRTPAYGMHLDQSRRPTVKFDIRNLPEEGTYWFGALGKAIGERLQALGGKPVAYIRGVSAASLEQLKSFSASLATYGGAAIFHMEGITPEVALYQPPHETIPIQLADLELAQSSLNDSTASQADFVSLGCPHLSIQEVARIAELLDGKKVIKEFWITTARPTKQIADQMGYTAVIEASGAKFAVDTCCVVAPIKGRFQILVTDSAKACYYAASKNRFNTVFLPFDQVIFAALGEPVDAREESPN